MDSVADAGICHRVRHLCVWSHVSNGARSDEASRQSRIDELNWTAIRATDWRDPDIKEGKQAEFLIEQSFPWELVEVVGVISERVAEQVTEACRAAAHRPKVVVKPEWYY